MEKFKITMGLQDDDFQLSNQDKELDYAYFCGGHGLWSSNLIPTEKEQEIKDKCNEIRMKFVELQKLLHNK